MTKKQKEKLFLMKDQLDLILDSRIEAFNNVNSAEFNNPKMLKNLKEEMKVLSALLWAFGKSIDHLEIDDIDEIPGFEGTLKSLGEL